MDLDTYLLIVGGSLNGLTTALLLAHRGVRCIVVERHLRTSVPVQVPRDLASLDGNLPQPWSRRRDSRAQSIDDASAYVGRMKNLADSEITWQGVPWSDTSDISPTAAATCDQNQLEPILRAHAEKRGADVRFNTELVDITQDADGLVARVLDRGTDAYSSIGADYLVAADGTERTRGTRHRTSRPRALLSIG